MRSATATIPLATVIAIAFLPHYPMFQAYLERWAGVVVAGTPTLVPILYVMAAVGAAECVAVFISWAQAPLQFIASAHHDSVHLSESRVAPASGGNDTRES
jgi:hypothetical protein